MYIFMIILCLFFFIIFVNSIIGFIKPEILKDKKSGKVPSKKESLWFFIFSLICFPLSLSYFIPNDINISEKEKLSSSTNKSLDFEKNSIISIDKFIERYNRFADETKNVLKIKNDKIKENDGTYTIYLNQYYKIHFELDKNNNIQDLTALIKLKGNPRDTKYCLLNLSSIIYSLDSNLNKVESIDIYKLIYNKSLNNLEDNINVGKYEKNNLNFRLVILDGELLSLNIRKNESNI
ncbi:hypothetical protein [Pigmentibacter ruber]|uniref:hypothetical protein n=1 Tax=Pigmentibacter ruber TaxID=2683196 RepID=UPI00131D70E4|nr:hypothetical protein [Pigmentibacter ruber]